MIFKICVICEICGLPLENEHERDLGAVAPHPSKTFPILRNFS